MCAVVQRRCPAADDQSGRQRAVHVRPRRDRFRDTQPALRFGWPIRNIHVHEMSACSLLLPFASRCPQTPRVREWFGAHPTGDLGGVPDAAWDTTRRGRDWAFTKSIAASTQGHGQARLARPRTAAMEDGTDRAPRPASSRGALPRCLWRHPGRTWWHVHRSMGQEYVHSRVWIAWNGARTKAVCTSCTDIISD